MLPSKFVTRVLISLAKVLPKKKIVPQKDLAELAFRDLRKKELVLLYCPLRIDFV